MHKQLIVLIFLLGCLGQVQAQQSFLLLEQAGSAKALALGGSLATAMPDAGMWRQNPALLDSTLSGQLLLDHLWYYAGVRESNLAFSQEFKKWGNWGLGIGYVDYGEMQGYDPTGAPEGEFSASDYVVQLSHARRWKVYSAGGSLKWASSGIAGYRANALLLDAGGTFRHPEQELVAGFVVRNLGLVTSSYTDTEIPELPLEVRLGVTFKPQFMPMRFTLTARHLQQPDLSIADPAAPFNKEEPPVVDHVMRHFTAGAEFLLSRNINLRAGYNHLRRQELKLENIAGMSGFSLGLMIKVRSFRLDYTRAWYHLAGGTSQLSLVTDMNRIFKNKI